MFSCFFWATAHFSNINAWMTKKNWCQIYFSLLLVSLAWIQDDSLFHNKIIEQLWVHNIPIHLTQKASFLIMFFYYFSIAKNWELAASVLVLAVTGLTYWFVASHCPESWVSITPCFPLINCVLKWKTEKQRNTRLLIQLHNSGRIYITRNNGLFVLLQILKNKDSCD